MTRPTARVLALLEALQSGGTRTVSDLAARLEVDERTVRRYIEHLKDLDVPVRSVRGRYGGYRLAPGFRMPFYTDRDGRSSERVVLPYGIVAHSGRWYVTGADSRSGDIRSFRLDRISAPAVRPGSFEVPDDFDPAEQVVSGIAQAPWTHSVSLRIKDTVQHIRRRLPAGIATVHEMPSVPGPEPGDPEPGQPELDSAGPALPSEPETADHDPPWIRVQLRDERLDWVPSVLASLDRPFVIEHPPALRDLVHALARRLNEYADADARSSALCGPVAFTGQGTTVTGHRPARTRRTASEPSRRCPAWADAPTQPHRRGSHRRCGQAR